VTERKKVGGEEGEGKMGESHPTLSGSNESGRNNNNK
jgi:hypothetical protein